MKNLIARLLVLALPALFVACANSSNSSDSAATTPLTTNCLSGTVCNNGLYNSPGFLPYPGSGSYFGGFSQNNAFCSCPSGYIPAYNNYAGLGCVANSIYAPVAGIVGYYYLNPGNWQWNNTPQVSNIATTGAENCSNGVVNSCITNGSANQCGAGLSCRVVSVNSNVGLCVQ